MAAHRGAAARGPAHRGDRRGADRPDPRTGPTARCGTGCTSRCAAGASGRPAERDGPAADGAAADVGRTGPGQTTRRRGKTCVASQALTMAGRKGRDRPAHRYPRPSRPGRLGRYGHPARGRRSTARAPPAGHHRPVRDRRPADGPDGLALTYNGELYNAPELRAELAAAGVRFRGTSDTEVLLRPGGAGRIAPAARAFGGLNRSPACKTLPPLDA